MKLLFTSIFLFALIFTGTAQNCGNVTNFEGTIVNLGNGTSSYTFYVTIQATSGGSKSVNLTITCPGGSNFITNICEPSLATTRVVQFGPYIRTTCSGTPALDWTGHSNANCGGTTCAGFSMGFSPLPVELVLFESRVIEEGIHLKWQTASELNNDKFVLERSSNGRDYFPIAEMKGKGTSNETNSYSFVDISPMVGQNYYRLKQVDFGGTFEYSPVQAVMVEPKNEIQVYPTLAVDELTVTFPAEVAEEAIISIYDMHGALVFEDLLQESSQHKVTLPQIAAGQYLVQVVNGNLFKRTIIFKQ